MSATLLILGLPAVPPTGGALLLGLHLGLLILGLLMQLITVLPFAWCRRQPLWWRGFGYLVTWGGNILVYALFA